MGQSIVPMTTQHVLWRMLRGMEILKYKISYVMHVNNNPFGRLKQAWSLRILQENLWGWHFIEKKDIIYSFLKMSFPIKVGLNLWFYSIFPTHSWMIAKSVPMYQMSNSQRFNKIWRFELFCLILKRQKGNSHEAINLKSIYAYKLHFLSQTCMTVHQRCL